MNNKITFYKLNSPYPEDITKNCGLTGQELDENFFNLKTCDIKTGYWDLATKTITLERVDGSFIAIPMEGIEGDYDFTYDKEQGELHIETPGGSFDVTGFTTPDMISTVYSDYTMTGKATIDDPIGISPLFKPGMYRPALKLIDTTNGEKLPHKNAVAKGNRYLTLERVSDYGLLYNYNAVKKIALDLECQNSDWRVPSKADWDGMLNAIELCDVDRTHNNPSSSRALGKFAGAFLKTNHDWVNQCVTNDPDGPNPSDMNPFPYAGVDSYGFSVLPAGYGDGGIVIDYFKQRAAFWSNTQLNLSDVYAKRFDYNRTTVYQEAVGISMQLSIRLVKDFTGDNFNERETINGQEYSCVLMPDQNGNGKIWTQTNIAFSNPLYKGVEPNGGEELKYTEKYFVNEWNGSEWLKNEVKDGESIVLIKGLTTDEYGEYRVVRNALIPTSAVIYQEILTHVDEILSDMDAKLTAEIVRSTAADAALTQAITDEAAARLAGDIAQQQAINTETLAREAGDAALDTKLGDETVARETADTALDTKIGNEVAAREAADTALEANDIDKTQTYTISMVNGLTLLTNNGTPITISVDGDYGQY